MIVRAVGGSERNFCFEVRLPEKTSTLHVRVSVSKLDGAAPSIADTSHADATPPQAMAGATLNLFMFIVGCLLASST